MTRVCLNTFLAGEALILVAFLVAGLMCTPSWSAGEPDARSDATPAPSPRVNHLPNRNPNKRHPRQSLSHGTCSHRFSRPSREREARSTRSLVRHRIVFACGVWSAQILGSTGRCDTWTVPSAK